MPEARTRTTIALPTNLVTAVDAAVRDGRARSRNDFFAAAVRLQLAAHQRDAVDAAFAEMASDQAYQEEALLIAGEFECADWETLQFSEGAHEKG